MLVKARPSVSIAEYVLLKAFASSECCHAVISRYFRLNRINRMAMRQGTGGVTARGRCKGGVFVGQLLSLPIFRGGEVIRYITGFGTET
jgi:hypothetical protein